MILGGSPIAQPVPLIQGPAGVYVGERAHLSYPEAAQLCYQPGTAAKRCSAVASDWHVTIRRGSTQYFTVRLHGKVVARLVYHDVA